jgi:hypothetical protein
MQFSRFATRCTLITVASLCMGACDGGRVAQPGDGSRESLITSAGRLEGVVTRESGAPAQGLDVTALNHGVVVASTITGGGGEFSMRFVNGIGENLPADTLLTYFIQARAAVGSVRDSLVLRVPVAIRMTRNVTSPVVTTAELSAAY